MLPMNTKLVSVKAFATLAGIGRATAGQWVRDAMLGLRALPPPGISVYESPSGRLYVEVPKDEAPRA